jgi:hypothetical protein
MSPCLRETGDELLDNCSILEKVAIDVLQCEYRVLTGKALQELVAQELESKEGERGLFATSSDHAALGKCIEQAAQCHLWSESCKHGLWHALYRGCTPKQHS